MPNATTPAAIANETYSTADPAYPEFTPNALAVLRRRYLKRTGENQWETPDEMLRRVARNIAQAEAAYPQPNRDPAEQIAEAEARFYHRMRSLHFLPNSPTLMNAGRRLQQLSACFVLPVEDCLDSIFQGVKDTALIHKSGGGTGFDFSRLRPAGDLVGSSGGIASGPVSFMTAYDCATEVVKQGGTRRGANMAILSASHPDIMDFITMKSDPKVMQNFNVSVSATDEFMARVMSQEPWQLVNPKDKTPTATVNAAEMFRKITRHAWLTGDPGMVFLDRINAEHPNGHLGPITTTNPCGEQPLLAYESCTLASINLSRMLNGKADDIDWQLLDETARDVVRFLDNVIDMNDYPMRELRERAQATRRIGVGVMGFAELLVKLGIRYDSPAGLQLAETLMQRIAKSVNAASRRLAQERGPYPEWENAREWLRQQGNPLANDPPIRNTQPTTIAPTGTISIIAGTSSGIEPLFALAYTRNVMDNDRLTEVDPNFRQALQKLGYDESHPSVQQALKGGSIAATDLPETVKNLFRVSHDISPTWHVRMQAAWQKHCHNAVSKTVNLPAEATPEDVAEAYLNAYRLGCKGITVYRDGSKENQVLETGETYGKSPTRNGSSPAQPEYRQRPETLSGVTHRIRTGHGPAYVTINNDEAGKPFEVFVAGSKSGGCDAAQSQAITRLVTLALRYNVPVEQIANQLGGIVCCPAWENGKLIGSPADAIAVALQRAPDGNKADGKDEAVHTEAPAENGESPQGYELIRLAERRQAGSMCRQPGCNGTVVQAEGCKTCLNCGDSNCG